MKLVLRKSPLGKCLACGFEKAKQVCHCLEALYCNTTCQQVHWSAHAHVCKMLTSRPIHDSAVIIF